MHSAVFAGGRALRPRGDRDHLGLESFRQVSRLLLRRAVEPEEGPRVSRGNEQHANALEHVAEALGRLLGWPERGAIIQVERHRLPAAAGLVQRLYHQAPTGIAEYRRNAGQVQPACAADIIPVDIVSFDLCVDNVRVRR